MVGWPQVIRREENRVELRGNVGGLGSFSPGQSGQSGGDELVPFGSGVLVSHGGLRRRMPESAHQLRDRGAVWAAKTAPVCLRSWTRKSGRPAAAHARSKWR